MGQQGDGRGRARILVAALATVALAATLGLVQPAIRADADAYPSWGDVQNAMADVTANQALQTRVTAEIAGLQQNLARTQEVAEQKGEAYGEAQDAVDRQQFAVQQLQAQIDAAQAAADAALTRVKGMLHELAKPTGADLTTTIIARPGNAKSLLYRLGAASTLTQTSQGLYSQALQAKNTVQKLSDQADLARTELERRRGIAKAAYQAAQSAAAAAQAASDAATQHLDELQAQLTALQQRQTQIAAQYQAGVEARAAAARAAAAAAAAAAARTGSSGSSTSVSTGGWALPAPGPITSPFGMRLHPIYGIWKLHTGTDIGASCGTSVRAAHSGTVVYAGTYSDIGNYIAIDHGDYVTAYGHLASLGVGVGQTVSTGQRIAAVGSTGQSTGCHLFFSVRSGDMFGTLTDPEPFMAARGITLGIPG